MTPFLKVFLIFIFFFLTLTSEAGKKDYQQARRDNKSPGCCGCWFSSKKPRPVLLSESESSNTPLLSSMETGQVTSSRPTRLGVQTRSRRAVTEHAFAPSALLAATRPRTVEDTTSRQQPPPEREIDERREGATLSSPLAAPTTTGTEAVAVALTILAGDAIDTEATLPIEDKISIKKPVLTPHLAEPSKMKTCASKACFDFTISAEDHEPDSEKSRKDKNHLSSPVSSHLSIPTFRSSTRSSWSPKEITESRTIESPDDIGMSFLILSSETAPDLIEELIKEFSEGNFFQLESVIKSNAQLLEYLNHLDELADDEAKLAPIQVLRILQLNNIEKTISSLNKEDILKRKESLTEEKLALIQAIKSQSTPNKKEEEILSHLKLRKSDKGYLESIKNLSRRYKKVSKAYLTYCLGKLPLEDQRIATIEDEIAEIQINLEQLEINFTNITDRIKLEITNYNEKSQNLKKLISEFHEKVRTVTELAANTELESLKTEIRGLRTEIEALGLTINKLEKKKTDCEGTFRQLQKRKELLQKKQLGFHEHYQSRSPFIAKIATDMIKKHVIPTALYTDPNI